MHALISLVNSKWSAYVRGHFNLQVALSGGADSVVLLHILNQLKASLKLNLTAIHINHGISPNASYWAKCCQGLCDNLGVELTIATHIISRLGGESLENNARKIRYQEFSKSQASIIALAHHQNDQIETTLSQIFRGSDLHNVAGMTELSEKYAKLLWRPLLDVPRDVIEEYAREFNLSYISDESNLDTSYLRNFIRQDILPRLIRFDPGIANKILKLPKQIGTLLSLVDSVAIADLNKCLNSPAVKISVRELNNLSLERQINVITLFIKQQNLPLPSQKQIVEFTRQALTSSWDRFPQLHLSSTQQIIKNREFIYISN